MNSQLSIILIAILSMLSSVTIHGQSTISGFIVDGKEPIIGANIFIEGTYDGSTSELDGSFVFTSEVTGTQVLVISFLGYETKEIKMDVAQMQNLTIKIRESAQSLDAVTISASTFGAGDNSKVAVLKPLDMVTTAGSNGDLIAAMKTLPGTQANDEDGRLFVRGGDANETRIFIDGMRVFSPYTRTIGGSPSRGRYSPFLFSGASFSTGGYGAEFGQALSGVLDMNTIDVPAQTETNISLMTVGLGIGHTQKGNKQSLSMSASYIDLTPYQTLVPNRLDWNSPYRGVSGEAVYRYKTEEGLFKSYFAGEWGSFDINRYNINSQDDQRIFIRNDNYYSNTTYQATLNDETSYFIGASIGLNNDKAEIDTFTTKSHLDGIHLKTSMKSIVNDFFILNYGLDFIYQKDKINNSLDALGSIYDNQLSRNIYGSFIESDYFFSKDLAVKTGIRIERNSYNNQTSLSPRITLAQKLTKNSQVSVAYGRYDQEANTQYLYENNNLEYEQSQHFLVNYNYKSDGQILRLEGYYKNYNNLLTYQSVEESQNNGNGYAYGMDFFWRSNKLIKNVDFWISYSWLESKRLVKNYPIEARPSFASPHTLSLVGKRWFSKLKSQVSMTYRFASGRPYNDPNQNIFMDQTSKPYHALNMSWAYLISQQKILFFSVSNLTAFQNEFGKRFADTPELDGTFRSELIRPNADQFFFVGFFVTLSDDKTKNQLDNL